MNSSVVRHSFRRGFAAGSKCTVPDAFSGNPRQAGVADDVLGTFDLRIVSRIVNTLAEGGITSVKPRSRSR